MLKLSLRMIMQSRSFSDGYRFAFQGQETEKELFGGNGSFFKYRISDGRLGRFFAVDPLFKKYPWNSTKVFCFIIIKNLNYSLI